MSVGRLNALILSDQVFHLILSAMTRWNIAKPRDLARWQDAAIRQSSQVYFYNSIMDVQDLEPRTECEYLVAQHQPLVQRALAVLLVCLQ